MKYALALLVAFSAGPIVLTATASGNGFIVLITSILAGIGISVALVYIDSKVKP
jgi:hypothetical protein